MILVDVKRFERICEGGVTLWRYFMVMKKHLIGVEWALWV